MPEFFTARALENKHIRHRFFSRNGGTSKSPYNSLNASHSVGDDIENLNRNLGRIAQSTGVARHRLCLARQTHSIDILVIDEFSDLSDRREADGMVTAAPGIALGILTADCAPVLFADPEHRIVGACHAGWRGAVGGIVPQTIQRMIELGAQRHNIVAAIGPCIHVQNYEVGFAFKRDVLAQYPECCQYFQQPDNGRVPHFNLPDCIMNQLERANIAQAAALPDCTYARPETFFSHRFATHAGTKTGRQISTIAVL